MTDRSQATSNRAPAWGFLPSAVPSLLRDAPIIVGGFALFYALLSLARHSLAPVNAHAEISLSPLALPKYAMYSVLRIAISYALSLAAAVGWGYAAAHDRRVERFMIPALDTLQSIPVLSFLPGVMLAMVALFPTRQLGVELGSILLIFTGQVWNMAFSFYSSLKSIPREMHEVAQVYRWSWWQKFTQLELPYAAIGLVWNSMMSVAGAWFFLMVCEMFVLGDRDFRLPGLGSYLETAANAGDTRAIVWGLAAMIGAIVLIDQLVWRPVIAWAEKFKFEQVEAAEVPHSPVLEFLRHSSILPFIARGTTQPASERLTLHFARQSAAQSAAKQSPAYRNWVLRVILAVAVAGIGYAAIRMFALVFGLTISDVRSILLGAAATFLRVELTLLLAGLWTIPVGVYIGLRPKLARVAQPLAQVAASVPATALFPVILLLLIRVGGGLGVGSVALLLLGTQWYILFNVIAGAVALPTDLKEVCDLFRFSSYERWRDFLLPGIFPYLITGFVTASGGAWNATIIAEYFHFSGRTFSTVGLGAVISHATDVGDFRVLLAATMVMAAIVVVINRLVWRRLYTLASTRFKLES
jgi:NitT/TauT family transport system permease protein